MKTQKFVSICLLTCLLLGLIGNLQPFKVEPVQASIPSSWNHYKTDLSSQLYATPDSPLAHVNKLIDKGYDASFLTGYFKELTNYSRPSLNPSFESYDSGWDNWTHATTPTDYNEYIDVNSTTPSPIPDGSYCAHFVLNSSATQQNIWTQTFSYTLSLATMPFLNVSLYFDEMSDLGGSGKCYFEIRVWLQNSHGFHLRYRWFGDDNVGWNTTESTYKQITRYWQKGDYATKEWIDYSFNITAMLDGNEDLWSPWGNSPYNWAVLGVAVEQYCKGNEKIDVYVDDIKVYGTLPESDAWDNYETCMTSLTNSTIAIYPETELYAFSEEEGSGTAHWVVINQTQFINSTGKDYATVVSEIHSQNAYGIWGYTGYYSGDNVETDPNYEAFGMDFFEHTYLGAQLPDAITLWDSFLNNGTKILMLAHVDAHNNADYDDRSFTVVYAPDVSMSSLCASLKNGYFYTANASWAGTLLFETTSGHPAGRNTVYASNTAEFRVQITELASNMKLCLVRNGTYFANVTLPTSGSYEKIFSYSLSNDAYYRIEIRDSSIADSENVISLSQPIFFNKVLSEELYFALDYSTDVDVTISNPSYNNDQLTFTVTADSGITSTTKVYCGNKGEPTSVSGTKYDAETDYNICTNILTLTVEHSSSTTIEVNWGSAASGAFNLMISVLKDGYPVTAIVNLNGENRSIYGLTKYELPYGTYEVTVYCDGVIQTKQVGISNDMNVGFNFTSPREPLDLKWLAVPILIILAVALFTFLRKKH